MFKKVLVANRGEIALRVIRTLKEMGISSVAVFSEADRNTLAVKFADEAICIGPHDPSQSYLNIQSILSAAEITGVDAIHPGYGFLAENAQFAELCEDLGFVFIGPSADVISLMGDKVAARKAAKEAGVSIIPGSEDPVDKDEAIEIAKSIGFPVMLKAAAGGGGRGMRLVKDEGELLSVIDAAKREAEAAFGDSKVYVEKYIEDARHIEVQIIADGSGKVFHLWERECSIQRRHQKLIEEAPAMIPDGVRQRVIDDAVKLASYVGYRNAGTVEFLVDREGNHYFIEMNTRIQVEHPVTEMITGLDIVKLQLLAAAGKEFGFGQDEVKREGWAMEFRINAEDPVTFTPAPGKIKKFIPPGGFGIRLDTAAYEGYDIPPFYDSMIGKLIVFGANREEVIYRAKRALSEFIIEGVKTTIPLHLEVISHPDFVNADISVEWLESKK